MQKFKKENRKKDEGTMHALPGKCFSAEQEVENVFKWL